MTEGSEPLTETAGALDGVTVVRRGVGRRPQTKCSFAGHGVAWPAPQTDRPLRLLRRVCMASRSLSNPLLGRSSASSPGFTVQARSTAPKPRASGTNAPTPSEQALPAATIIDIEQQNSTQQLEPGQLSVITGSTEPLVVPTSPLHRDVALNPDSPNSAPIAPVVSYALSYMLLSPEALPGRALYSRAGRFSIYVLLVAVPTLVFGTAGWQAAQDWRNAPIGLPPADLRSKPSNFAHFTMNIGFWVQSPCVIWCFRHLRQAIDPVDGTLAKLGVNTRRLPIETNNELRLWTCKSWTSLLLVLFVVGLLVYAAAIVVNFAVNFQKSTWRFQPMSGGKTTGLWVVPDQLLFAVVPVPWMPLAGAIIVAWLCVLRACAVLAQSAIADVRRQVQVLDIASLSDDEWRTRIREPAVKLARETLPALSSFGSSVGTMFFVGCVGVLANIPIVAINQWPSSQGQAVWIIVSIAVPLGVASIPASVSTECDNLQLDLNEKRGSAGDLATDARIRELETYLVNSNGGARFGQGVGFVMCGMVLDKRSLKKIGLSVYSIVVPAITFLLTAGSDDGNDGSSS